MKKILLLVAIFVLLTLALLNPKDQEIRNEYFKYESAHSNAIDSYDNGNNLQINNYILFSTIELDGNKIGYAFMNSVNFN